jgi:hypothetical protein
MRSALFLLALSLQCAAPAQDCTQTVPAIMLDGDSRVFVPAITPDRLHAKLGSVLVPVASVEQIQSFRVLVLLDTSASMDPSDAPFTHRRKAMALINSTLDELLGELPHGAKVEYGLFDNYAVFGPEFTADREELRKSLDDSRERMKHRGVKKTALYDAIRDSMARFDPAQPGDSILIVTDGEDNESRLRPGKVQDEAAQKGVRVFSILTQDNRPEVPDVEGSSAVIFDFAERTGGSIHVINMARNSWLSTDQLEQERQDLRRFWNNEVLSGYLVHFILPASARKQRKWLLSVDRLPGQKTKILAAYPSRLNACPVATAAAR